MVHHSKKNPYRLFSFRRLKVADIHWLASWVSEDNSQTAPYRARVYDTFNNYYHAIWHSRLIKTWVMTIDKTPAFALTLLRLVVWAKESSLPESGCGYQLTLLTSPMIMQNEHKLLLAWQAASIHVFLKLDLPRIQVTLDDLQTEENQALVTMGYQLVDTTREGSGIINIYICNREDFRPVL